MSFNEYKPKIRKKVTKHQKKNEPERKVKSAEFIEKTSNKDMYEFYDDTNEFVDNYIGGLSEDGF